MPGRLPRIPGTRRACVLSVADHPPACTHVRHVCKLSACAGSSNLSATRLQAQAAAGREGREHDMGRDTDTEDQDGLKGEAAARHDARHVPDARHVRDAFLDARLSDRQTLISP